MISRNDTSRFTLFYLVDWIITIDIISCAQFVPKNKHKMFMSLISTFRKGRSMASWEEFFESTVLGEGWYTNVELAVVIYYFSCSIS
jgi:hypothetical protein